MKWCPWWRIRDGYNAAEGRRVRTEAEARLSRAQADRRDVEREAAWLAELPLAEFVDRISAAFGRRL